MDNDSPQAAIRSAQGRRAPTDSSKPERLGVRATVEYVRRTLDAEIAHRDRSDKRATFIITATGGLAALTGALAALLPDSSSVHLTLDGRWALIAALVLFVVAVCCALYAGFWTAGKGNPIPSGDLEDVMQMAVEDPLGFGDKTLS